MSEQHEDVGGGLIVQPQQLAQRITEWQAKGYHVLSPAIRVMAFSPGTGVNVSLAMLDPRTEEEGGSGDVYFDRNQMDPDERAPSKIGLNKIASLAGVNWVHDQCGRRDPMTIQNFWIYHVTGVYLSYDGTPQTITGEKEIDYRDGSAQIGGWSMAAWEELKRKTPEAKNINGWSAQRVMQARCNGAERAETGAIERAIRTLGIKHTYKVAELAKPFVVLRVSSVVDTSDPGTRAQLAARVGMSAASLYAGTHLSQSRALNAAPEVLEVLVQQPKREVVTQPVAVHEKQDRRQAPPVETRRESQINAALQPPDEEQYVDPRATDEPQADAKLPDGAKLIRKVVREPKTYGKNHQKAGQAFTLWHVWFEGDDQEYTTAWAAKWGKVVDDCFAAAKPVLFTAAPNNFGEHEILNIKEATPVTQVPVGGFKL